MTGPGSMPRAMLATNFAGVFAGPKPSPVTGKEPLPGGSLFTPAAKPVLRADRAGKAARLTVAPAAFAQLNVCAFYAAFVRCGR